MAKRNHLASTWQNYQVLPSQKKPQSIFPTWIINAIVSFKSKQTLEYYHSILSTIQFCNSTLLMSVSSRSNVFCHGCRTDVRCRGFPAFTAAVVSGKISRNTFKCNFIWGFKDFVSRPHDCPRAGSCRSKLSFKPHVSQLPFQRQGKLPRQQADNER